MKSTQILSLISLCLMLLLSSTITSAETIDISQLTDQHQSDLGADFDILQTDTAIDDINAIIHSNGWKQSTTHELDNFGGKQTYLRLKLYNSSDQPIEFLLIQDNPQLLLIDSWFVSNDESQYQQLGAIYPFSQRPVQHRKFIFPYTLKADQHATVYFHVEVGARDMLYRTHLWQAERFFRNFQAIDIWEIFYFGVISVMALYNLVIFGMVRDRSYLYYAVFVSSALLTFMCISGYAFQFLWPNLPWFNYKAVYAGMGFMIAFAGWFSIHFLKLQRFMPRLAKSLHSLSLGIILLILLIIILPMDKDFTLVRILGTSSVPVYLLCWFGGIHMMRTYRDTASIIYVVAWSMLILAIISTLVHESVVPLFPIPTYTAVQIAHCIEVILLSMALAHHINILKIRENVAAAKADEKSRFLARMSHEIRTPMNGIIGMTDLLIDRIHEGTDRRYLEVIHSSANTLEKVINDILDYSKIEAGKLEIRQQPFSLSQLTNTTLQLFELTANNKSLQLGLELAPELEETYIGDIQRLQQILNNLVSNAIKYTHEGSVTIRVTGENDSLCFNVEDSGEGIAEVDQQRLFEPFEQARNNNLGRESSTGLGLAICRELIQLMHGEIGVESTLGEGSNFWFCVPLKSSPTPQQATEHKDEQQPLPQMRILVAEDNQVNQVVIKNLLDVLDQETVLVSNGVEAVGYYKQSHQQIDLILMDCEMPAMDGFKATQIIRQFEDKEQLPRKPIIALTAHTLHKELQHCYDSGMDDLLLKPVTRDKVRTCLLKHLPENIQPQHHQP